jgi:streptogramin lyase
MTTACSRCGLLHPQGSPCFAPTLPGAPLTRELEPGTVLAGRYLVVRTIHHGGMSVVYFAEDTVQNRQVAVKELRLPDGATVEETREAEAWFARESYLLSTLQHPLIPRFYSVFREQDRSYLVQEYVAGENLDQVVTQEGPVREDLVVHWARELCDLLRYLHQRPEPVIFRDLKPANMVLREGDDSLAVVDFGIARPYHEGQVGTVVGTPGYAPPEQYQGLATPSSDIYALGATMHRLLTGYDPEHATPFTFPPVCELNHDVSPAVAAIVNRALALNPADRFADATAMNEALARTVTWPIGARLRAGWLGAPRSRTAANTMARRLWSGMAIAAVLAPLLLRAAAGSQLSGIQPAFTGDHQPSMLTNMLLCAPMRAAIAVPGTQLQPGTSITVNGNTLWFTDQQGVALDYLTADGQMGSCEFAMNGAEPQKLVSGADGTLWLLEAYGTAIDRISPDGGVLSFPFNTAANGAPADLTVTSDGAVWFTQPSDNTVTRLWYGSTPGGVTGTMQHFHLAAPNQSPQTITSVGGSIWFSEQANRVGHISPQGTITSVALPGRKPVGVAGIAAASDGSAWLTEAAANRVVHVGANGVVQQFSIPTPDAGLGAITVSSTGAWFVEQRANKIGVVTPSGHIEEYSIPTPNSRPMALTIAPDGSVWFTELYGQNLGRVIPGSGISEFAAIAGTFNVLSGTRTGTPYLSAGMPGSPTR